MSDPREIAKGLTKAHVDAVRNARFVACAALSAYQGPTLKRRDEAKEQARLLSEVADAVESLAVRAALQEGA